MQVLTLCYLHVTGFPSPARDYQRARINANDPKAIFAPVCSLFSISPLQHSQPPLLFTSPPPSCMHTYFFKFSKFCLHRSWTIYESVHSQCAFNFNFHSFNFLQLFLVHRCCAGHLQAVAPLLLLMVPFGKTKMMTLISPVASSPEGSRPSCFL